MRPMLCMLILFGLMPPTFARAELIFDFEDLQGLAGLTSLTYVRPDLTMTITRSSGTTFDIDAPGVPPFGNGSLSPFNGAGGASVNDVFQVELSRPVAAIFVDAGDFGGDADALRMEAFFGPGLTGNSAVWQGALVAGGNNFSYVTMQLTTPFIGPGFQSFTLSGGGTEFPNSVYYDNFRFRLSAVPEPGVTWLSVLAGAIFYQLRRRWPVAGRSIAKAKRRPA